jgi:hypothetical protein
MLAPKKPKSSHQLDRQPIDSRAPGNGRVALAGLLGSLNQLVTVRLARGGEAKRVRASQLPVVLNKRVLVHQLLDALTGRESSVVLTLVTHLQVVLELTDVEQLATALVLAPHPQVAALRRRLPARRPRLCWNRNVRRAFAEQVAHLYQFPGTLALHARALMLLVGRLVSGG